MSKDSNKKIYTVSQINALVKSVLENSLPPRITIRGEISNFKKHKRSGHCYFSLKDERSSVPCVMWKSNHRKVKFDLENGLEVLATGFIDVYVPHGRYQLMAEKIEPAGTGALQLAFEKMVEKLKEQGLFEDSHKKALPRFPKKICILTSESGAAIEDIRDSIFNRWPVAELLLYSVPVQGEGAAKKIAGAIRDINKRNDELKIDLLIVSRGGGSMEDLWEFNEEVLARAIFDSDIPVISAVGHEVDVTISDLVADARASTPTKAGVAAVPDKDDVISNLDHMQNRIKNVMLNRLELSESRLDALLASALFKNPLVMIRNREQQIDEIQSAMESELRQLIRSAEVKLNRIYEKIRQIEPHRLLGNRKIQFNRLESNLNNAIKKSITERKHKTAIEENRLKAMNPKSVLKRGYSITTNKQTGNIVKSFRNVKIDEEIITEIANEKIIESKVTSKKDKNK